APRARPRGAAPHGRQAREAARRDGARVQVLGLGAQYRHAQAEGPGRAQRRAHQQRVRAAGGVPARAPANPHARPAPRIEPPARRHLRPIDRRADPEAATQDRGEPQPAFAHPHRARRRLLPEFHGRDDVSAAFPAIDGALTVVAAWLAIGFAGLIAPRSFRFVAHLLFPVSALLSLALAAVGLAALPGAAQTLVL